MQLDELLSRITPEVVDAAAFQQPEPFTPDRMTRLAEALIPTNFMAWAMSSTLIPDMMKDAGVEMPKDRQQQYLILSAVIKGVLLGVVMMSSAEEHRAC